MTGQGIAIIGAGMIGAAHASGYRQFAHRFGAGYRLDTICDMNRAMAQEMAKNWGFARVATDWREAIADPDIGVISVCLPNFLHAEVTIAALEAGKHVLCEKPLALGADAAGRVRDAALRAKVTSGTVFNYRRIPAIAAMRALIQTGEIGQVFQASVRFQCDYAADPLLPHSWRYEFDKAGPGALLDIGTHAVDVARFLCGEVAAVAGAVSTISVPMRHLPLGRTSGHGHVELSDSKACVDNDDVMSALLRFESGAQGYISASRVTVGTGNCLTVEIAGTDGTLRFSTETPSYFEIAHRRGVAPMNFERVPNRPSASAIGALAAVPHDLVSIGYAEVFGFMIHEFLDALHAGRPLENGSMEDGFRVAQVLDAIQAASVSPGPVAIDHAA